MAFLTRHRLFLIGVILTLLLAGAIAVLTLAPVSAEGVHGSDKLHHVLGFAALAFPLPFTRQKLALPVVLGVAAYGGVIELIQPHVGREAEWGDFLADVAGAAIGATLGVQCGKWFRRRWLE
jgi:VanZ family protein